MADTKLVIANPKTGKTFQQEIDNEKFKHFSGKKIGDKIKGEVLDYTGYEFEITGGSDKSGFPMRLDLQGARKGKILATEGIGLKRKKSKTKKGFLTFKGTRQRKTVAGNTIGPNISQINIKITKEGPKKIGPEAEENKEEPKEEKKEEAKEEKKEKPAEKPEEKKE